MNKGFLASKVKDRNVVKETIEFTEKGDDIEVYMWKKLFTDKEIYNRILIDKQEFIEFAKELINEEGKTHPGSPVQENGGFKHGDQ